MFDPRPFLFISISRSHSRLLCFHRFRSHRRFCRSLRFFPSLHQILPSCHSFFPSRCSYCFFPTWHH